MSSSISHTVFKVVLAPAMAALILGGLLPSLAPAAPSKEESHDHTPDVCSKKDATICAHLGLPEALDTKSAKKLIVDIKVPKNPKDKSATKTEIKNLKVKLWMPDMNHGSLPVKITPQDDAHFLVTDVRFSMAGLWQVRLDFDVANSSHHIEIPVDIKE